MVDGAGRHSGGPFRVDVTPKMRVLDLRRIVQVRGTLSHVIAKSTGRTQRQNVACMARTMQGWVLVSPRHMPLGCSGLSCLSGQRAAFNASDAQTKSGIPCGLQRLSYAGKHMDDSQRTLEQCGHVSCTLGRLCFGASLAPLPASNLV